MCRLEIIFSFTLQKRGFLCYNSKTIPLKAHTFMIQQTFLHFQICPSYAQLLPCVIRMFTLSEVIYRLYFAPLLTLSDPTHIGGFILM